MKTFKELVSEARPQDYIGRTPEEDEDKKLEPKAEGEKQFKAAHVTAKKDHPVAGDNQFQGTTDHSGDHEGHAGEPGEREPVKQGTSTLSQFMNKISSSQTPTRKGDKRQGDLKPVMAKEEFELQEGVVETLKKIVDRKQAMPVTFKNRKTLSVDPKSASAILKVHGQLNSANAKKMTASLEQGEASFMKMLDFAMM